MDSVAHTLVFRVGQNETVQSASHAVVEAGVWRRAASHWPHVQTFAILCDDSFKPGCFLTQLGA